MAKGIPLLLATSPFKRKYILKEYFFSNEKKKETTKLMSGEVTTFLET